MAAKFTVKFDRKTRTAVAKASDGCPDLGTWLNRVRALDIPVLTEAIDGIWCGRNGRVTLDLPGSNAMLCMGWYHNRVEWSYLS
jgi:hypothetical protein